MKYDIKNGVKGLIFDLDGTLVDSMPLHFEGWKKACEKFGARMDPEFLKYHAGTPGWEIAKTIIELSGLNGNVTEEEIMEAKIEEFHKSVHLIKPIEPVAAIAKKYHGILPMAIGTGGHRETVERTMKITGMDKYFDIVVTANDVKNYKPHPETFLKCAKLMNMQPEDIEVFEDGDYGIKAAKQAGMTPTDVRQWYLSNW
jgi:beta-phosphoglucomutase family hydrolase